MLKKAGYKTVAMGKWHLGFTYLNEKGKPYELYNGKELLDVPIGDFVPNGAVSRGFDSYIGFHHSTSMNIIVKNNKVIDHMAPIKMLQFLGHNAADYITKEATSKEPFFMYLALNSPHSPVVPSKAWQGKSGMGDYADFVMETDDVVGKVLEALEKNGIADNTIVFFTSDNGTSYPTANGKELEGLGHYPSANFRGSKSDIWEGGHRVPFMVRWPGKIEANSINDELICQTSLMATCAEINNLNVSENVGVDSYSILPLLKNRKAKSNHKMVIHHSIQGKFSIRNKKWKLELTPGSGGWTSPTDPEARKENFPKMQLYNMKKDQEETTNLYKKHPRIVKKMTLELEKIVKNGRTTQGQSQENDVMVDIFKTDK
ncbi:sulfatase-like hydrolase/transferase [Mariniflexile ostreae]|uniref:Sulfatase-like hydrolase/transferase n=1 Tax=Mariniflexile ostreae TaxID=1520892 RepID=A0ABV5FF71_9FLAO